MKKIVSSKMMGPAKWQHAVEYVQGVFPISERRACRVMGISRSSRGYHPHIADEEASLNQRIVYFATGYWWCGYRRITDLLRREEWRVNHRRIEQIWLREGLKIPPKQPKRRRL